MVLVNLKFEFERIETRERAAGGLDGSGVLLANLIIISVMLRMRQTRAFSLYNRRFLDKVRIRVKAGDGGDGCSSFERSIHGIGGPDGGNGGAGGDIYLESDEHSGDLSFQTYHFSGLRGAHGGSALCHGRKGEDMIIKVPAGTVIREVMQHDESMPLRDCPTVDVADLASSGNRIMAAKGGAGGLGNKSFRNALRKAPTVRQEGQPGEARVLELELKTIADVGLVGFPNAGKSTFLSAVSAAEPKIAPYPFTTLHPYVGMVEYDKLNLPGSRLSIADLPGLIDGAHLNRGLGHSFLRHIERTKILLYVLDIVGSEGRDPIDDFTILQRELELYARDRKIAGGLIERPSLILANKLDLDATKAAKNIERLRKHTKLPIFAGSAQRGEKLAPVLTALRRSLLLELQPVKWPQGRVAGPPKVIPRTL